MPNFPPNSQKAREAQQPPREKVSRVTSAETVRRKRGLGRRFKETFIAGTPRDAGASMVEDVVIPAIRETIHEALRTGLDHLILGGTRKPRASSSSLPWATTQPNKGRVDYQGYGGTTTRASQQATRSVSRQSRARHEFHDLVIPSRMEAQSVIDQMFDIVSQHGEINIAELYEMTGIESSHVDLKWGWTDLSGARAVRLRTGGYLLDLPDPQPL